jgi:hypothetical protein
MSSPATPPHGTGPEEYVATWCRNPLLGHNLLYALQYIENPIVCRNPFKRTALKRAFSLSLNPFVHPLLDQGNPFTV